jgi:tellurite resistance protein TerC
MRACRKSTEGEWALDVPLWFWLAFFALIAVVLALDLGVFNRDAHVISLKEAALWTAAWVSLAMLFNLGIYLYAGSEPALQFLTGYLVEKSLAVDNIFVFVLIFTAFAVPQLYQHRVLFWGIIGALVLRSGFIAGGAYLVENFHWILYLFGAFLLFTGIKMFRERDDHEFEVEGNIVLRFLRRVMPVTSGYTGTRFLLRDGGRWIATPLFAVMAMVMVTDVVFAVDSIPAIFAITQDPFLVLTSNVFAVLGLRSMYFLLADVVNRFEYLRHGLSAILVFIGVKMLLIDIYKVPIWLSLGTIGTIFAVAIIASVRAQSASTQRRGGDVPALQETD